MSEGPVQADSSKPSAETRSESPPPQNVATELQVDHEGTTVFLRGTILSVTDQPPLILVHDFGEGSSIYRGATKAFTENGFSTVCFDMRGHGRSGKRLGHFETFDSLITDLLQVAAWIRQKSNRRAPVVIAQGLAAMVALGFQQKFPNMCSGIVLCAPVLKLRNPMAKASEIFIRTLADIYPKTRLPIGITPKILEPIAYGSAGTLNEEKPETLTRYSAWFIREIMNQMETLPGKVLRIKGPTLIVQAGNDQICDYAILDQLLKRHKRRQFVKEVTIADSKHNLLTETTSSLAASVSAVANWLESLNERSHESTNP